MISVVPSSCNSQRKCRFTARRKLKGHLTQLLPFTDEETGPEKVACQVVYRALQTMSSGFHSSQPSPTP